MGKAINLGLISENILQTFFILKASSSSKSKGFGLCDAFSDCIFREDEEKINIYLNQLQFKGKENSITWEQHSAVPHVGKADLKLPWSSNDLG